ncbi:MAG: hypothetical protein IJP82_07255 [Bacteroidaceae bacterium]|nr:hypothetical protein [Bacteroidaceae bacterium]
MKRNLHFCGIFAIAMVAMTMFTITSCDKDEEYELQTDEYTLADRMMTRAGEGGNNNTPHFLEIEAGRDTSYHDVGAVISFETIISWNSGVWALVVPTISTRFKDNINEDELYEYSIISSEVSWGCGPVVKGSIKYTKKSKISGSYMTIEGEFEQAVNIVYIKQDEEE